MRQVIENLLVRTIIVAWLAGLTVLAFPHSTKAKAGEFPVAGERQALRTIWVVATAYSSDRFQTDNTPCIPANGYDLCEHYEKFGYGNTIAANFLPLETQVRLPDLFGNQILVVRDRMHERFGPGRIDIWMPSRESAQTFGVKYLQMEQFGGGAWRWTIARK